MSHPTLAAAASTSAPALRHRSSTLKPLHDDPAPVQPHPPPVARSKSSQTPAAPAPAPIPSTPRTGLRAHLAQLLPRHAVFRARITLHQLNNVPLVRGEFAVRWHVRGVVGRGFLSKVKVRSNGGRPNASHPSHSAKGKEPDVDTASLVGPSISDTHSVTASSSTHSYDHASSASSHASVAAHRPPVVPALVVSPGSSTSSVVPPLASRSVSGTSLSAASPREPLPQRYLSMDWFPHPHPVHDPPPSRLPLPPEQYSPAKSRTPFVSLKDHNVVWQQPLDFLVQMAIRRESGELLSSPASFVVMQARVHLGLLPTCSSALHSVSSLATPTRLETPASASSTSTLLSMSAQASSHAVICSDRARPTRPSRCVLFPRPTPADPTSIPS